MSILTYGISVLCMILLPCVLGMLLRRRYRVPWILFCLGALTFVVSQVVHLPLNRLLENTGILPSSPDGDAPLWRTALILGLTAGLCEELARTATYAIARRWRRFEDGFMLGLGHGGIESMIFGGVLTAATVTSLLTLANQDLSALGVPAEQIEAALAQSAALRAAPAGALLPLVERIAALGFHVSMSLLVLQAFTRRNPLWVGAAIAAHTLFDALAFVLSQRVTNGWIIELAFLAAVAGPVYWVWRQRSPAEVGPDRRSARQELGLLWASLRKELVYLWRTRRVIVVAAVFVLFGLVSPVLARFTPEILSSVEGAEQFADLIPSPTVGDAIDQYVKNLSQFGFLIVVVVGMGAIAGEKEKGTAAMILSKPLCRWQFVTAKFIALCLLYTGALAIGMLGGYYYTLVLFGTLPFGTFVFQNVLLLLWLLSYVSMTLLGSALGKSTASAAAYSLGGCVLLLLASNLPKVGGLAPAGLLAWVGQIGAGTSGIATGANGGAAAMGLALIALCVITSIAVFERQELD